jgi:hypothetical protein
MVSFPEGLSYAVLEGKQTAKLSEIHEAIADLPLSGAVAAPSFRMTNSCLHALIAWYKILRELPLPENLAVG